MCDKSYNFFSITGCQYCVKCVTPTIWLLVHAADFCVIKNIIVHQNLMNFKNGVKIQKPPASLALRQESNFNMFKNLFLRMSGPKEKEILQ